MVRALGLGMAVVGLMACEENEGLTLGDTVGFADWSLVEPDHPMVDPATATTLDAAVCIDRLGATSIGRANAHAALLQLNDLPGVDITVTVRDITCGTDADIWANPGMADLLVTETVDTCLGGPLNATAGVCYHTSAGATDLWTISSCAALGGDCRAEHAVIMLRESNYSGSNEPSVGVIAHELGHALGMVHGYWDEDECTGAVAPPTQVRALDQHHFMGATVTRGSGRGVTHGDDQRSGRISAYTLAFLQDRYPAASTTWAAPEWFAHEMVIERDTCVTERPATPATHWESRDHHPTELCADAATGSFVTCGAGTNPSFTLQFSSKSAENCTAGAHARLTIDGVEVARGATVTPDCTDPLRQYTWTVAPTILQSTLPAGPLPRTVPAVLEVVSASPTPEGDASDNAVRLELTLQP